jgi:hypothetical protein
MVRLFVQLNGGLGNQLFQYAIGRAVALRNNAELVMDVTTGFARDFQYKRQYELGRFSSLEFKAATLFQSAILLWFRIRSKLQVNRHCFYERQLFADFYIEKKFVFHPVLASSSLTRDTWLLGYWQSPKYFASYAALLRSELMPPAPPIDGKYSELAALLLQSDSIALGIRLYEESRNPGDHASTGRLKTTEEINLAINKLRQLKPQGRVFVFCTHRAPELAQLNLPPDTIYVTPDEGYADSVSCLWLLTRCKHHIFTNSSFYWWGAWLSHAVHNPAEQIIFAADNFINVDGLCEHWNTF